MKRLTTEQINEIVKLRNEGKTLRKIADKFKVQTQTILYHTSEDFRIKLREYNRKRYNQMSPKEKREYLKNKREYQRIYHQERYANDLEFRKKQLERVKNKYLRDVKGGKKQ